MNCYLPYEEKFALYKCVCRKFNSFYIFLNSFTISYSVERWPKMVNTSYATLSSGILWNIPRVTITDKWDIPWYNTRKCCITVLYHVIENTLTNFRRE